MVTDGSDYSEDTLIEKPAIMLFGALGWETADCFHEFEQSGGSPLGRETDSEVVLVRRLRAAPGKLNPKAPAEAIAQAIEEITRDRSRTSLARRSMNGFASGPICTSTTVTSGRARASTQLRPFRRGMCPDRRKTVLKERRNDK